MTDNCQMTISSAISSVGTTAMLKPAVRNSRAPMTLEAPVPTGGPVRGAPSHTINNRDETDATLAQIDPSANDLECPSK
jgi:hypothetical protein